MCDVQKIYENICRLQKEFEAKYEVWKPISITNGKHEISSFARIRNSKTKHIMSIKRKKRGYHIIRFRIGESSKVSQHSIHRFVATAFIENPFGKRCVDHIDNDRCNNHVANLRWVTDSQNSMNKSMMANNTSGITGVSWNKQKLKWRVRIMIDGKNKHLGYFSTKGQAEKVRIKYANQLFGEYTHKTQKL